MGELTVRAVDDAIIAALEQQAAEHGRSAEEEHRDILRSALLGEGLREESFAERAARTRRQMQPKIDSAEIVRWFREGGDPA